MKLRLLLTKDCNRHCRGCCNKDWDLNALPVCKSYKGYSEILLTGGEPMLYPDLIRRTVENIRAQNKKCAIYLYTAKADDAILLWSIVNILDGITLTLHTKNDLKYFRKVNTLEWILSFGFNKSRRLNVFKGIPLNKLDLSDWKVKSNMYWVKNAPLPEDEVFMRLPTA